MRRLAALVLLAVLASSAWAADSLPKTMVANLPSSGPSGMSRLVTDGSTEGDCTVGGGSFAVLCRFDGTSTWAANSAAGAGDALTSGTLAQFAATTSAQLAGVLTNESGTGVFCMTISCSMTTPILGTPTSGVITNLTGLPLTTGVTGILPVANGGTGASSIPAAVAVVLPLTTPASASATCTTGTFTFDTGFFYGCTATNTWKRVAIATW